MTRGQRRWHLVLWLVLGVLIAAGFAAGWAVRP